MKGQGFTIKVKELPDLADGIQRALEMALAEARKNPKTGATGGAKPAGRAYEGAGAPF